MPGVLNVTGAGSAAVLPLGVPPGKLQEKVRGRFPSGSLPVPAKSTLWPARMVWSVAGAAAVTSRAVLGPETTAVLPRGKIGKMATKEEKNGKIMLLARGVAAVAGGPARMVWS